MTLKGATPALPVSDIGQAVEFYESKLGFERRHVEDDFAIVARDGVEVHLWAANKPGVAGAEPHIAGTGSCRIEASGVGDLSEELAAADVVHPHGALESTPWGTEEFTVLDTDNNAITFYERAG
jgi:catechol 2,3-dioxygenase-like lactoylglutathione lyase family enzyme